jgi:drug/metabolite transporter (DMT)-like permease
MLAIEAIWGSTFIIVKEAIRDASTLTFLALRFTMATLALAIVLIGRYRKFPAVRLSVKAGIYAGLTLFVGYFFQTAGLRYTTAPKSAFITSLSVVAVPLLTALVYRSVPSLAEGTGVVLATAGLGLLTLPDRGLQIGLGDLLTVVCALGFGAHIVVVGHYTARCSFQLLSLAQVGTAGLIAVGTFWWAEQPRVNWTPRLWIALLVTSILATALAFSVMAWAQRRLSPGRTALLLTLEPVFAWITSFLVAGETLPPAGAMGAGLILAGILLAELKPTMSLRYPSG